MLLQGYSGYDCQERFVSLRPAFRDFTSEEDGRGNVKEGLPAQGDACQSANMSASVACAEQGSAQAMGSGHAMDPAQAMGSGQTMAGACHGVGASCALGAGTGVGGVASP